MDVYTATDEIDVARIPEDEEYKNELCARMITDLWWLAKYVLGYKEIGERHREVANIFIKKDPSKPIRQQSPIRTRILLLPRRCYKTTFNISDSVQWILAFPDIAIMAMTASNSDDSPLADAFVEEVASHFLCVPGAPLTALHLCFPEHVIHKKQKVGSFMTPARTKFRRDPTLMAVSIEQSLSGWHPDIIKSEDVQDNRNSQTAYGLKKVRTNFYINLKMLGEGGMLDVTATRYGPMDLYGDMLAKAGEETKVLWKSAYIRKPHALSLEDDELTEEDVTLQFPEQLSWEFLRSEKRLDESSYWTQYMNVATGGFKPTFPMERLNAAKVPEDSSHGKVHVAWRFEYGDCKNAAGAVGIEANGRMTIVDVVRGQFAPTALAAHVVKMCKRWESHRVEIEQTPGADVMVPHIRNQALESDWRIEVTWSEFLQDATAQSFAIKCAEPHLLAGRLLFADGINQAQEMYRQLYHFGMVEDIEIASVIARVSEKLPASIAAEGFDAQDEEAFNAYIEQDSYDRVYGRGRYEEVETIPEPEIEWEPQGPGAGLEECMPGLSG